MGVTDICENFLYMDKLENFRTPTLRLVRSESPNLSPHRQVTQPPSPEVRSPSSSIETLILSEDDDEMYTETEEEKDESLSESLSLLEEKGQEELDGAGGGKEDDDGSRKLDKCIICLEGNIIYDLKDVLEPKDGSGKKVLTKEELFALLQVQHDNLTESETTPNDNEGICATCYEKVNTLQTLEDYKNGSQKRYNEKTYLMPAVTSTDKPLVEGTVAICSNKRVLCRLERIAEAKKMYMAATHAHLVRRLLLDKDWDFICRLLTSVPSSESSDLKDYLYSPERLSHIYCVECRRLVENGVEGFKNHWMSEHPYALLNFPCEICGSHIQMSQRQHHSHWISHFFFYKCHDCDKKFPTSRGLEAHWRIKHTIKADYPWKCDHCEKSFRVFVDLKHHQQMAHRNSKTDTTKPTQTPNENSKTASKSKKISSKKRNKNTDLDWCSKDDVSQNEYNKPTKLPKYLGNEKDFSCSMCEESYATECSLLHHVSVTHTNHAENMELESEITSEQTPESTTSVIVPYTVNGIESESQSCSQLPLGQVKVPQDPSCTYLMTEGVDSTASAVVPHTLNGIEPQSEPQSRSQSPLVEVQIPKDPSVMNGIESESQSRSQPSLVDVQIPEDPSGTMNQIESESQSRSQPSLVEVQIPKDASDTLNRIQSEPQSRCQSPLMQVQCPEDFVCPYLMNECDEQVVQVEQNSTITSNQCVMRSSYDSTDNTVTISPALSTPTAAILPESQNIGPVQLPVEIKKEIEVITLDDDDEPITGVEKSSPPGNSDMLKAIKNTCLSIKMQGIIVMLTENVRGTGNQPSVVTVKLFVNGGSRSFPFQPDSELYRLVSQAVLAFPFCIGKAICFPLEISSMHSFAPSASDQVFMIPM